MKSLSTLAVERPAALWLLVLLVAALGGLGSARLVQDNRTAERLQQLELDVERHGIELISQTLNGNLMGAVAVLGLIDPRIKQEAVGALPANNAQVLPTLESIGRSYDADGVFLVARDGKVTSSWDNAGKPSTGIDVKFRPYYQMAMQGMDNVYAAVSLARGDRSLYFSAPVFVETTNATDAIGAVVARTSLLKVDALLRDAGDLALLLSPQGVVFASKRGEWIGRLSGTPSPERLRAIRELRQFGNMFVDKEPALLPLDVDRPLQHIDGRRYALAKAPVRWNDPFGDWTLVIGEDIERTVPAQRANLLGTGVAAMLLVIGGLLLGMLRGQQRQAEAAAQLERFARQQTESAQRKARLSAVAVRLQRAGDEATLVAAFLDEARKLADVLQGAVYRAEAPTQPLRLLGSYACDPLPPAELAWGEGLLGQCALERRAQVLSPATATLAPVRSGLGSALPAAVLLTPVLLHDRLLGVAELALLQPLDETRRETLDEMIGLLAMNIEILARGQETRQLLEATVAAEHLAADQLTFQRILLDTIPYPVFYKGADTRYLGVNRAYEAAFGVRREDLIGRRVVELTHIPDAERTASQREDEQIIAAGTDVKRESTIPFADGSVHEGEHFTAAIVRPDGTPGGVVGMFIDLTASRQAERELARLADVERFNRIARGREKRILELKHEVNVLAEELGRLPVYESAALSALQAEAEAFAAETGTAPAHEAEALKDPAAVQRLIESLQQERLAALSLAEDAEAARRALAERTEGEQ